MSYYVYRAFDEAGIALYVGCTENYPKRLRFHACSSEWYRFATRFEADAVQDRAKAFALEAAIINELRPQFNQLRRRTDAADEEWSRRRQSNSGAPALLPTPASATS